jgi:hypothetical protein
MGSRILLIVHNLITERNDSEIDALVLDVVPQDFQIVAVGSWAVDPMVCFMILPRVD